MLVNRSHLHAFSQMGQMLRLFYFISYHTTHTNTHTCLVRNTAILNEKRWGKHSGLCIANVRTMALQCVCAYRCMFANPFVFKLFPWPSLFKVTQAGFPSRGGGRVQAAEEDLPRGRGQEGHLKVLGYGEVWWKLAGREHILWG